MLNKPSGENERKEGVGLIDRLRIWKDKLFDSLSGKKSPLEKKDTYTDKELALIQAGLKQIRGKVRDEQDQAKALTGFALVQNFRMRPAGADIKQSEIEYIHGLIDLINQYQN